jgi:hypothetical protein
MSRRRRQRANKQLRVPKGDDPTETRKTQTIAIDVFVQ